MDLPTICHICNQCSLNEILVHQQRGFHIFSYSMVSVIFELSSNGTQLIAKLDMFFESVKFRQVEIVAWTVAWFVVCVLSICLDLNKVMESFLCTCSRTTVPFSNEFWKILLSEHLTQIWVKSKIQGLGCLTMVWYNLLD